MSLEATIDGPQNPYALSVTNDLDQEDDDELLIVPEFYGGTDDGGRRVQ